MFKLIKYVDCDHEKWDKFVDENFQGYFFHLSCFLDAWPYGENCSFVIADDEEILLLCAMQKYEEKKVKKKFFGLKKKIKTSVNFDSIGGFFAKDGLTEKKKHKLIEFFQSCIDDNLQANYTKRFHVSLSVLPEAFWPENMPKVNPLLPWGFTNDLSQSYVVDLSQEEDVILHNCSETTRQEIKKIKNNSDYVVRIANSTQEDLDIYYNLHLETYNRTGATPHPKSYFEHIFFDIMPLGINRILFMEKGREVVAAQNSVFYKEAGLYWTGASLGEKDNGINKFLTYLQILYAKEIGCRYYEVGEAFPHIRSGKLKGLNDFKKSFGGFLHPIWGGIFESKES